jgi:TPR repeat protein
MTRFALLLLCLLFAAPAAPAAGIPYLQDPVYGKIHPLDEHPMQDLVLLAQRGDVRAQFIVADLYAKGKGGLGKSAAKARFWFESAARKGLNAAFIRLAALSKHERKYVEAYQWYSLAVDRGGKEGAWARNARAQLAKERRLTDRDKRIAEKAAERWKSRQAEALRVLQKKEQRARETLPKPELDDKSPSAAQQSPYSQEYSYNE